jgi:hypothetical protein
MPESQIARGKRDLTWTIDDATTQSYDAPIQVGNFGWTAELYDVVDILDRASQVGVRKGDDKVTSVSFTCVLTDVGSSSYLTICDICEERGFASTGCTSTTANQSDVFTWDFTATMDGSAFGESDRSMLFADMYFRQGGASVETPALYPVVGRSATATKPVVT